MGIEDIFGFGGGAAGANAQMPAPVRRPVMPDGSVAPQAVAPGAFQGGQIAQVAGPQANMVNADQTFRGAQTGLMGQLQGQAAGDPNSAAFQLIQRQTQQAQQANQAALMSQLASQRGAANPLAARTAAMMNAQQGAQLGQNAQMAGLQAQQQAQAGIANLAGTARQQDIGTALANQQAQNEMALAGYRGNVESALARGQLGQRTAETMYGGQLAVAQQNAHLAAQYQDLQKQYANMGMSADEANQMAALKVQQMRVGGAAQGQAQNRQLLGALAGGAAGFFAGGGPVTAIAGAKMGSDLAKNMGGGGDNSGMSNDEIDTYNAGVDAQNAKG
jgi:hypothetical protein